MYRAGDSLEETGVDAHLLGHESRYARHLERHGGEHEKPCDSFHEGPHGKGG
jgi:hypothetical protein